MLNIQQNIPLAPYTTFRIGGPAKYFVEVKDVAELEEALRYAQEKKMDFFILGGGSNLLVADNGYNGMVIKCRISDFNFKSQNSTLEVGAGVALAKCVGQSINNTMAGLEWAAGIPGTIGGAVRGNAGAFGRDMGSIVISVKVLEAQADLGYKIYALGREQCNFTYRDSVFKHNRNLIVLSAVLQLSEGSKTRSLRKMQEIIQQRIAKQPQGMPSAGSFFVNPVVENMELIKEFEAEKNTLSKENKLPAPWLIERAGLMGKKIGGAMVSEKHANYIVNTGHATAEDVIMLASIIKQQVRDKFKVQLKEEVQMLGF